jgi:hypothetical protein
MLGGRPRKPEDDRPEDVRVNTLNADRTGDGARRQRGWLVPATGCLVIAVGGAVVIDQCTDREPPDSPGTGGGPNSAYLMKSMIASAAARGEKFDLAGQMNRVMEAGRPAPDFTLPRADGTATVSLSALRGRPVVLAFGSFSCDQFVEVLPELDRLALDFDGTATFVFINVTEAGHRMPGLEFVLDPLPTDPAEARAEHGRRTARALSATGCRMTGVLDVATRAEIAYDAFPLRLVVVDPEGRIACDLGRGFSKPWDLGQVRAYLGSAAGK